MIISYNDFRLKNTMDMQIQGGIDATGYDATIDAGNNTVTFFNQCEGTVTANDFTIICKRLDLGDITAELPPGIYLDLDGSFIIQPYDSTSDLRIGSAPDVIPPGSFELYDTDLEYLNDNTTYCLVDSIIIGRTGQTGEIILEDNVDISNQHVTINGGFIDDSTYSINADELTLDLDTPADSGGNTMKVGTGILNVDTTDSAAALDRSLTVTGDSDINFGDITLDDGDLVATAGDDSTGTITFTGQVTGNTADLEAGLSILNNTGTENTNVTTTGNADFKAHAGTVGTVATPVYVSIGGLLNVEAGGQDGAVSANFKGTTSDNTTHLLLEWVTPGAVWFNHAASAPPTPTPELPADAKSQSNPDVGNMPPPLMSEGMYVMNDLVLVEPSLFGDIVDGAELDTEPAQ